MGVYQRKHLTSRIAGGLILPQLAVGLCRTHLPYVHAGSPTGVGSVGSGLLAIRGVLTVGPGPSRSTW